MQYYLIAPFVFLLFGRRSVLRVTGLFILIGLTFYLGRQFEPMGFVFAFLIGFFVNLLPKLNTTPNLKKIGLVVSVLIVHLGFNYLYFYHLPSSAIVVAALASAAGVYICESRSMEERPGLILRWGMLTGYLTYGFYLWHYVIIRSLEDRLSR
jgi:peptidoglycan/LPS O-acetylase OafA/YrhL